MKVSRKLLCVVGLLKRFVIFLLVSFMILVSFCNLVLLLEMVSVRLLNMWVRVLCDSLGCIWRVVSVVERLVVCWVVRLNRFDMVVIEVLICRIFWLVVVEVVFRVRIVELSCLI